MSQPDAGVRVSVVQLEPTPFDLSRNRVRIERAVRQAASDGSKLAVLPELADTGYLLTSRLREVATSMPGATTDLMCALAAELDITIVAALATVDDQGELSDNSVIVTPAGIVASARKNFLWGEEKNVFLRSPGSLPAIADTPVGRIGVAICYEAGFPEVTRELALRGADIIAVPSAFGMARVSAWKLMTRSRALENGCFVLAANLVGPFGELEFCGYSTIVGPGGERLAFVGAGEAVVTTKIFPSQVATSRAAIPYLEDVRESFEDRAYVNSPISNLFLTTNER